MNECLYKKGIFTQDGIYHALRLTVWCMCIQRDKAVNVGGYMAAAVGGAILALHGVRSTAYLPAPLAIAICDARVGLLMAMLATFAISFIVAYVRNSQWNNQRQKQLEPMSTQA